LMELDALLSLIFIIIYGLFSLRSVNVAMPDVYLFSRLLPIIFVSFNMVNSTTYSSLNYVSLDFFYALLIVIVMCSQNLQYSTYGIVSFESILMLLFTFIGGIYMIHSTDLLTFYIALEAQNFSFMVLCGLHSPNGFGVEATLKYFLLSAFSSGVILFMFSLLYLQTGQSSVRLLSTFDTYNSLETYILLCAMMFKLGAAPLHLWVVQIYGGVKRSLLMYIATAPKYSLFAFWVASFQAFWTDFTVVLFAIFSLVLGSIGAFNQIGLRSLFAYSTINEIGLLLLAIETAGFHSLFQHLGIYIISQALLWNISDKRLFTFVGVSLAGLPPLAGFFGKAWIFWHTATVGLYSPLVIGLVCTAISLVYYLRVLRLFPLTGYNMANQKVNYVLANTKTYGITHTVISTNVVLTTTLLLILVYSPLFFIKPFVF